jgi:hypothetical protein
MWVKKSVTTAPEHDELDEEEALVELCWSLEGVLEGSGSFGSSGSSGLGSLFLLPGSSGSLCLCRPLSLTGGHFPSGISMLMMGTLILMHPPRWKSGSFGRDLVESAP